MAKRTSFQDADENNKTLADLINEENPQVEDEQEVEEPSEDPVEDGPEEVPEDDEDPSQGSGEGEPEVTEDTTPAPFSRYLAERGYEIPEGLDESDLIESVFRRMQEVDKIRKDLEQERKEREKLLKEQEELRKSQQAQAPSPAAPPEQRDEKPSSDDFWGPLEEPDRELMQRVEQDPNTGMFRSREEYQGFGGEEAARKINEYNQRLSRRSQAILKNPADAVFQAGLAKRIEEIAIKKAESLFEEKIKGLGDIQGKAVAAFDKRREAEAKQQRISSFYEEHGDKFLKRDPSGRLLTDLGGDYIPTDIGKAFYDELAYIKDTLQVKDEETALKTAWRNISRTIAAPSQQEAPPKTEPETPPQESGPQKRRKFVERRNTESPSVPANRDGYAREGRPERSRPLSLSELVKEEESLQ
ncbi:MAG: hypothetical protein CMK32_08055 [Porticoccaceae bacterium]|nr:hypothetical protein [Porticoccaceae bacterium]